MPEIDFMNTIKQVTEDFLTKKEDTKKKKKAVVTEVREKNINMDEPQAKKLKLDEEEEKEEELVLDFSNDEENDDDEEEENDDDEEENDEEEEEDDDDDEEIDIDEILDENSTNQDDTSLHNSLSNSEEIVNNTGNDTRKAADYAKAAGIAEIKFRKIEVPGLSGEDILEVVKKFESPEYESIDFIQLENIMNPIIDETTKYLEITRDIAIILLRRNNWDSQVVIHRYTTEKDALFAETGLSYRAPELLENSRSDGTFTCSICEDDVEVSDSITLGCGHCFCIDCWTQSIAVKMKYGWKSEIATTLCPGYKCKYPIPDSVILKLLSGDETNIKKFREATARQFVQENKFTKWCPGRDCEYVVHTHNELKNSLVMCKGCNYVYCFNCNDYDIGDHRPCSCDQMKEWNGRAQGESESIKWLMANAKQCPKCHVYIEKNEGCMHMTCNKEIGGCGYEWCWLCRGPWSEHNLKTGGYYTCNKYATSKAKELDDSANEVKKDLEHYMFYFHRYNSFKDSRIKALAYLNDLPKKEEYIRNHFISSKIPPPTNFSFLFDAVSTIIEGCRTLAYSYIYGYFIKEGDPTKELFVFSQEYLERFTLNLTEMYEKNLQDLTKFESSRSELVNLTKVTLNYLENFNESIKERK